MNTNDRESLIIQFSKILQIDIQTSEFFLESSNWNVETAINNFMGVLGPNGASMLLRSRPEATFLSDLSDAQAVKFAPGSVVNMVSI